MSQIFFNILLLNQHTCMKIYVYLIVFFIYVSKTWDWDSLEVLNKRITRDPSQAALLLIYHTPPFSIFVYSFKIDLIN